MDEPQDIIDLTPEPADQGELRYSSSGKKPIPNSSFSGLFIKVIGIALGLAIFLLLVVFFVYVVIPIILVLIVWAFLRNLFASRR